MHGDFRGRQRYVAMLCQSHPCGEYHVDQRQQGDHRGRRVATRRAGIVIPILCEKDRQRRHHNDYCGLYAPRDQAGLE
jgi:hypothetical protein